MFFTDEVHKPKCLASLGCLVLRMFSPTTIPHTKPSTLTFFSSSAFLVLHVVRAPRASSLIAGSLYRKMCMKDSRRFDESEKEYFNSYDYNSFLSLYVLFFILWCYLFSFTRRIHICTYTFRRIVYVVLCCVVSYIL